MNTEIWTTVGKSSMDFHYTWQFGRHFAPLLRFLRGSGFFDPSVYLSVMTIPAAALFLSVFRRTRQDPASAQYGKLYSLWQLLNFLLCWMALNSLVAGFKTMIVEELVYQERKWFEPYLPGIHFYIASACLTYLFLIVRPNPHYVGLLAASYVQIALLAGYGAAGYRVITEDLPGAIGGVIMLIVFGACNYDLVARARRNLSARDSRNVQRSYQATSVIRSRGWKPYQLIALSVISMFSVAVRRHGQLRYSVAANHNESDKERGIGSPSQIEPEMVRIPAGEFLMGSSDLGSAEKPVHRVYLDEYYIGKFEVTNIQYKAFCDSTGSAYPRARWTHHSRQSSASYLTDKPGYPVVDVDWDDAIAYTEWLSQRTSRKYRLPTEAEWEKAARGALEAKKYPWGDEEYDAGGQYRANVGSPSDNDRIREKDGFLYTAQVGSFPPNGYGLYDMAGNVWEWCNDAYDATYYVRSPYKNPQGPNSGEKRVTRGGSWFGGTEHMKNAARLWNYASIPYASTGFRVAMTP